MYFQNKAAIKLERKKVCQVALTDRLISAIRDVHGDFETKTHVASCRCLPFHGVSPKVTPLITANRVQRHSEHRYVLCPTTDKNAIGNAWNLT